MCVVSKILNVLCILFQVQCIMFYNKGNTLIVQSLLCTPYGQPAFTLAMGDATIMKKSVFSPAIDHLRSLTVKQVIYCWVAW